MLLEWFDLAKAALILASALIYFVMPVDLFPDMIPIVGHLDDLAVLVAAIPAAYKLYKKWEARREARLKKEQGA